MAQKVGADWGKRPCLKRQKNRSLRKGSGSCCLPMHQEGCASSSPALAKDLRRRVAFADGIAVARLACSSRVSLVPVWGRSSFLRPQNQPSIQIYYTNFCDLSPLLIPLLSFFSELVPKSCSTLRQRAVIWTCILSWNHGDKFYAETNGLAHVGHAGGIGNGEGKVGA
jgi:hypothetical protein